MNGSERPSEGSEQEKRSDDTEREVGERFRIRIGRDIRRRRRVRNRESPSPWMGLTYFGMVGWPVVLLTVIGTLVGAWLSRTAGGPFPWTLVGVLMGAFSGIAVAAYWLRREHRAMPDGSGRDEESEREERQ